MEESKSDIDRLSNLHWKVLARCDFVQRTFHPYACLLKIASSGEQTGQFWEPYRGQTFDPEKYRLIENGWDHEHCTVCGVKIENGDRYWTNEGCDQAELCLQCHPLVQKRLLTKDLSPKNDD